MSRPARLHGWCSYVASLLAGLITLAVFVTAIGNQFVDFDDLGYIVTNPDLRKLDLQTLRWAFFESSEANWHPLTLLSLALEHQLWGLTADGVHLANIVIHCCTVMSAFYLFREILCLQSLRQAPLPAHPPQTAERTISVVLVCCSLAAALFFGLHPLRVESVVWASERKDVLCLFFLVNALRTYLRFSRRLADHPEYPFWRIGAYWGTLALACLAQMSKPVAVSLPLILLILDRYPLGRTWQCCGRIGQVAEKIPFFLISIAGAVLTVVAQRAAMDRAPEVDILSRSLIACKALLFYIVKTAWPSDLTALYLHPGEVTASSLAGYLVPAAVVAAITVTVVAAGRRYPAWRALWFFHVVTLLPMLGLIQVGGQWAADRYSYLPALGISLLWGGCLMWCLGRLLCAGRKYAAACCALLAVCQLAAYTQLTLRQIPVWRTTETLMTRIIDRAELQSWSSFYTRAKYLNESGKVEQALEDIDRALELARRGGRVERYAEIAIARAHVLYRLGRISEAMDTAGWALRNSTGRPPDSYTAFWQELKRIEALKASSR